MKASHAAHNKTAKKTTTKKTTTKKPQQQKPKTTQAAPAAASAVKDPSTIPAEIEEPKITLSNMKFEGLEAGKFPHGEEMEYTQEWNLSRKTSAEMREREAKLQNIEDYRKAAEVHKEVRHWCEKWMKPGMSDLFVVENIERKVRELCEVEGVNTTKAGMAFPCGVSLNNIAAHQTPYPGDDLYFYKPTDVVKVDFGVHVNGYLIDSAFTMTWDPKYQTVLDCAKDATNTGIKTMGVDVRLCDIGDAIEEVMNSYELEVDGKTITLQPIRNLCGHMVDQYHVHAGVSIPICKGGPETKMEENQVYAMETFASSGKGRIEDTGVCSHYMCDPNMYEHPIRDSNAKNLLRQLDKNFSTLAFCRRYVDKIGFQKWQLPFKFLVDGGAVNDYPTLADVKGSIVAQFEHTIYLKPTGKEVLSRSFDY